MVSLALLCASPVRAQETLALGWDAPEVCPEGDSIREEVTRLLGGAIPEQDESVQAHGVMTEVEGAFRLTLSTSVGDVEGERTLEGESCEELGQAAALILALMIDPEAVASAEVDPAPVAEEPVARVVEEPFIEAPIVEAPIEDMGVAAGLSAPESPPASVPSAELERGDDPTEEPEDESLRGFLGVAGLLDVGSLPDVSGGVALEGGLGVPLVAVRLRATYVAPRRVRRDGTSGAEITVVSADARACVHPFEGARFVYGCAGLLLGVAIATGFGFDRDETGVGTFGAAVVGLGLAWRVASFLELDLGADLNVPFNPLEFGTREADGSFHQQSPVAGRFGLTARLIF